MIFEIPKDQPSAIKVIGVGGAGSNAVSHMYKKGIKGVEFYICNTDKQALEKSPVPNKVQLGVTLTRGRGAGSVPDVGRSSAIENLDEVKRILENETDMVFITAGMGGGTGTGAAPVIAQLARELGILTVAIVTFPFAYEGSKRKGYAEAGLEELRKNVDSLLVIRNDKLRDLYKNQALSQVFAQADEVLCTAAQSISEIIVNELHVNIDMNDVNTVMRESGVAIMGSAVASGEDRAIRAVEDALNSPLLNDNNITGARHVLLNIISGTSELTIDELGMITDYVQEAAGQTAEIINGYGSDESLGDSIKVTIIATGFNQNNQIHFDGSRKPAEKVVRVLDETPANVAPQMVQQPSVAPSHSAPEQPQNPLEPFLKTTSEPVQQTPPVNTPRKDDLQQVTFEFESSLPQSLEPVLITRTEMPSDEVISTPSAGTEFQEPVNEIPQNQPPVSNIPSTPVSQQEPTLFSRPAPQEKQPSTDDQIRIANERIKKLREMSLKISTPQGLNEIESRPAYERKGVQLENLPASGESHVSRYTLGEGEDSSKPGLRANNSFLHDQPD